MRCKHAARVSSAGVKVSGIIEICNGRAMGEGANEEGGGIASEIINVSWYKIEFHSRSQLRMNIPTLSPCPMIPYHLAQEDPTIPLMSH